MTEIEQLKEDLRDLREDFSWLEENLGEEPGALRVRIKEARHSELLERPRAMAALERAEEVLGSREEAIRWLNAPVPALGGKTPASVVADPDGLAQVLAVLGRIEHGVF